MIFESFSSQQIADNIQAAIGGAGTDEAAFIAAIRDIKSQATLVEVNQILASDFKKYTYPSVGNAIDGELGMFDQEASAQITKHLADNRLTAYVNQLKTPPVVKEKPRESLISTIIDRVIQHEGKEPKKYIDSRGIPTVGVGFNLNNADSSDRLKRVGANPAKVKAGKVALSEKQIKTLLIQDLEKALGEARDLVENFDQLPQPVQGVLVEMAFNLGKSGLSEFQNFLNKISRKRWKDAAREMLNSDWKRQVGNRALTLANIVKSAV